MTKRIVHEPGDTVGMFVIVCSEGSTPRGDSLWCVRCTRCGHEFIKRGTEVRQALKGTKTWQCVCEQEERRAMAKQKAEAKRKAAEERNREADRQHLLRVENRHLYFTWMGMKARCYRKTHPKYKHYGARGIYVCDEWRNDFEAFCIWSLKHGYRRGLTIDRRDNDREYSPENCRWTTYVVQNNNRRPASRVSLTGVLLAKNSKERVGRTPKTV